MVLKNTGTKFRHSWTNGLVERMNRTIKGAKRASYDMAFDV